MSKPVLYLKKLMILSWVIYLCDVVYFVSSFPPYNLEYNIFFTTLSSAVYLLWIYSWFIQNELYESLNMDMKSELIKYSKLAKF